MFKTVLTAAAATLAFAPAMAQADETYQFSHEGVAYTYTTEHKGDVIVVSGRSSINQPFRLVVKGERVTGTFNSQPVRFTHAAAGGNDALAAN